MATLFPFHFKHVQQWPNSSSFDVGTFCFFFLRRYFGCALCLNGIKIDYKQQMQTIRTIIATQMPKCQYNKTTIENILPEIAAKICSDDETKIHKLNSKKNRFCAIKRHIVRIHMKKKFLSQTVFISFCLLALAKEWKREKLER